MLLKDKAITATGAQIVIETFKSLGVDTVFGYPGGVVLSLYDELYKQDGIKHILTRHEQSAVHAAEGYARSSGKCGVVFVTSGPGATNTITGIANAYLDGYPLVIITGQVSEDVKGKDAFQEADICSMVKSCTKKAFQIKNISEIQAAIIEGYNLAMSGKRGPVLIDIPKNLFSQCGECVFSKREKNDSSSKFPKTDFLKLVDYIQTSESPLILAGGGVVHCCAEDELFKFAKDNNIPVVCSMMGMGAIEQNISNYFGMIGIFGDKSANALMRKSDLIISLGSRFNDRINCMFKDVDINSKFIQIDINEDEIAKNVTPKFSLVGDIKVLLKRLNECKIKKNFSKYLDDMQTLKLLNVQNSKKTNLLHSFEVLKSLDRFTKDMDVIFTSEVGQHQVWAVKNLTLNKSRKLLLSGGSGTMGFGFPASIGAFVAKPNSCVVCITGDGSFQMSLHELATCKDLNANIKIIILNNGYLGMVRQLQEKNCDRRYSQTKISNPNFVELAKSYGIDGLRVNSYDEIDRAFEVAFGKAVPFVIEFMVEPMEVL